MFSFFFLEALTDSCRFLSSSSLLLWGGYPAFRGVVCAVSRFVSAPLLRWILAGFFAFLRAAPVSSLVPLPVLALAFPGPSIPGFPCRRPSCPLPLSFLFFFFVPAPYCCGPWCTTRMGPTLYSFGCWSHPLASRGENVGPMIGVTGTDSVKIGRAPCPDAAFAASSCSPT